MKNYQQLLEEFTCDKAYEKQKYLSLNDDFLKRKLVRKYLSLIFSGIYTIHGIIQVIVYFLYGSKHYLFIYCDEVIVFGGICLFTQIGVQILGFGSILEITNSWEKDEDDSRGLNPFFSPLAMYFFINIISIFIFAYYKLVLQIADPFFHLKVYNDSFIIFGFKKFAVFSTITLNLFFYFRNQKRTVEKVADLKDQITLQGEMLVDLSKQIQELTDALKDSSRDNQID